MRSSNLQTIDEPVTQWRPGDLGTATTWRSIVWAWIQSLLTG